MATLPVPSFSAARAGLCLALMLVAAPVAAGWPFNLFSPPEFSDQTRDVIFVGNNWEGTVNVIDAETYEPLGTINAIPDKSQRITEIYLNPVRLLFFQGVRLLIGEGNHQYVDDMYSSNNGRLLVVSRPSFADVVALDVITGEVVWRFQVDGYRSDHMAISPDGKHVAVSASTGGVVHVLDVATGEEVGNFPSGDSPHENIYSEDGERIFHAAIGQVFTPLDRGRVVKQLTKGERLFQIVDAETFEIIKRFDLREKLDEAGYTHLSPAIRPMAHTDDERYFYFQVSFFHGFLEYDMEEDRVTRLAHLPNLVPNLPREKYVNDSAHHGIALSGDQSTLCVAGTMSDYVAIVSRETFEYTIFTGIGEKPYWVTTSGDGEHCYISWSGTDQMSVFSYESGQEVARLDVGDHPQRVREGRILENWLSP